MNESRKHSLALDYHENTKSIVGSSIYDEKTEYKIYPNAKTVSLKQNNPNMANDSFIKTLLSRKSTRAFTSAHVKLDILAQLLTLSCGQRNGDDLLDFYRTYASAGTRYPIEVYIVIFSACDIEQGIYHYNIKDNSLELIKRGDYSKQFRDIYKNQESFIATDYPCLILFSMVFERTMQKYGERGYRFILLDAGHMSQNLYLTATYLGLGIVALGAGATSDKKIDDILGLVSSQENVFYGFALGHPQS